MRIPDFGSRTLAAPRTILVAIGPRRKHDPPGCRGVLLGGLGRNPFLSVVAATGCERRSRCGSMIGAIDPNTGPLSGLHALRQQGGNVAGGEAIPGGHAKIPRPCLVGLTGMMRPLALIKATASKRPPALHQACHRLLRPDP